MKRIMNYLLLFSLLFCLEGVAQKEQNRQIISNKTTAKGKRELKREMRIRNATLHLASENERRARKEHKLGTVSRHDQKAKKLQKDRKKAKQREEKKNEKAAKAEMKNGRESKDRDDKIVKTEPADNEKG